MSKDIILGIESSCDDTSASILEDGKILSNVTYTQVIHKKHGGVVPELASRAHMSRILPTIHSALEESGRDLHQVNAIAFTRGPGLLGSLLVGVTTAKSLALALDIPLIEVHHMHAHIMAHFIDEPKPPFPFLCLTVSGGHTQIVLVKAYNQMEILGQTIDDAAGEAFDKAGKMLNLEYPAGPLIDKWAQEGQPRFKFNKPRIDNYDYSFSGLKTSILYTLRKEVQRSPGFINDNLADLACSIQETIVDILIDKFERAAIEQDIKHIAIAGGVSANSGLRSAVQTMCEKHNWMSYIPDFQYCTDNAAMIAISGYYKYLDQLFTDHRVRPEARLPF